MGRSFEEILTSHILELKGEDWWTFGKYVGVSSTAVLAVSTPIYTFLELGITELSNSFDQIQNYVQMNEELSKNARITAAGATYGGLGVLGALTIKVSRDHFKVPDNKAKIHDSLLVAALNTVIAPCIFIASGADNIQEITTGTGIATAMGFFTGPAVGRSLDIYNTLVEIKDSEVVPQKIKDLGKKTKLGIAAGLTAASVALTCGMYSIYDSDQNNTEKLKVAEIKNYDPNNWARTQKI